MTRRTNQQLPTRISAMKLAATMRAGRERVDGRGVAGGSGRGERFT